MRRVNSRQYIVDSSRLKLFVFSLFTIYFLLTTVASAQTEYNLLTPLPIGPRAANVDKVTFATYMPGIINLAIGIAAVLAVVMIIYGGIQYMSSDAFQQKSDAKDTIQHAIWGLVLAISSWLILYTVNPNLVNLNLNIERQELGAAFEAPNFNSLPLAEQAAILTTEKERVGCPECIHVKTGPLPARGKLYPFNNVPFPSKPPSANGCEGVQVCYVHKDLYARLVALANELHDKSVLSPGIQWQVTEMIPQTVDHTSNCHKPNNPETGKCVDASIGGHHKIMTGVNTGCTVGIPLKTFLEAIASQVGGNFQYEVGQQKCYDYYRSLPYINADLKSRIKKIDTTNKPEDKFKEHAHINL